MDNDMWSRPRVTEAMLRAIRSDIDVEGNLMQNVSTLMESFGEVAVALSDMQDKDLAFEVLNQVKELVTLRENVKHHKEALISLVDTYECPEEDGDLTDFDQVIKTKASEFASASNFRSEDAEEVRSLQAELGNIGAGGNEQAQEMGEDEDLVIDDTSGLAPNDTCPLTLKPILEIDDPVEDAKGIVYERRMIEESLHKEPSNAHVCPMAGTNHIVRLRDLVPARRVMRERKRRFAQASGAADSEELDDVL
ncbi:hypothetical protein BSKO_10646 [Bryopsis sp. KO-2023]|nr:hypothetical protein BSKO_10646 [Bryopsis sp. KO-2023]